MSHHELEQALREGGEKVTEGRIRIDAARALQRLRDFRFADPAHWVLEVLRATVLGGATHVEVVTDADDVTLTFDGRGVTREAMPHLLEQALNAGATVEEQRLRLLSLGVAGALGAGADFVTLQSDGATLRLTTSSVDVVPGSDLRVRTRLQLRKRFGWRVVTGFFRGSPEAKALEARAHRFPGSLMLNGRRLPERTFARPSVTRRTVKKNGWALEVSLPAGPPRPISTLDLDVAGVLVASRELSLPGVQVEAWLRADGLRRNASGSDVVEDDETLQAALTALKDVSRTLLLEAASALCAEETWRQAFIARLLAPKVPDDVRRALEQAPLLPGPAGEWVTLAEVKAASSKHGRVHVASRPWPKGTYPDATVLLSGSPELGKLLPESRRLDVEKLVHQRERIVESRRRVELSPREPASLGAKTFDVRGPIETGSNLVGEVGLATSLQGAFVRVLHDGRLLESGELDALSPLCLRAVVDVRRPLGDSFFDEGGPPKVLGLVLEHVETAATRAILAALPRPEALPHAFDLLTRLAAKGPRQIPPELLAVPLFPCLEGGPVSLGSFWNDARWRYTRSEPRAGLLDGSRVLRLDDERFALLEKLGRKKLEDVTELLDLEVEVRRRIAGPPQPTRLLDVVVTTPVQGEGLSGVVGIPRAVGARLSLTMLKQGLLLESTDLSARYQHAAASVDCAALTPNPRWTAVTRDAAFQRVSDAVHEAQRRLVLELLARPRAEWRPGGEAYFLAFLKKELVGFDPERLDDVTRAVVEAKVFDGGSRRVSLAELKQAGRLLVLDPSADRGAPSFEELLVVTEAPALISALADALDLEAEHAGPELERRAAVARLQVRPVLPFELPQGLALKCRLTLPEATALAGLSEGVAAEAKVEVRVQGRAYASATVDSPLPLVVVLERPTLVPTSLRELSATETNEVRRLVELVAREVLTVATREDSEPARRAMLLALGRNFDAGLPQAERDALWRPLLFPCTDGARRALPDVSSDAPAFVSHALSGTLPDGRPIIVADTEALRVALRRWRRVTDVEKALRLQLDALAQRSKLAPVERVVASVESPWRQPFAEDGAEGEVVIAREGAGRLELFIGKKPLCVVEGALPAPFAAAVDAPQLTPRPGFTGVVEDAAYTALVAALTAAGSRLAQQLDDSAAPDFWKPTLVRLAFQLASTHAWVWKGKKKGKKAKATSSAPLHPLVTRPLLRLNDGQSTSLEALLHEQQREGSVAFVTRGGTFLEPGRQAWWPREEEVGWARTLSLSLDDLTPELERAETLRARPRLTQLGAPLASAWCEPVRGAGLEGELALPRTPDGTLLIEVLHDRRLIESWSALHPVGGVARVDGALLSLEPSSLAVKRDAQFKALVTATEAALERLLVRRLEERDPHFAAWAMAAVKWKAGRAGPLAAVVPTLPLFEALDHRPLTVGAVLELATREGRVSLAQAQADGPGHVLLDSPATRAALSLLELKFEDVTAELTREKDLRAALTSRRLDSLSWKGEAVLRLRLDTPPLKGELALSSSPGSLRLAREGIPLQPLEHAWPGVVGVVDIEGLAVDAKWEKGTPTRAQLAVLGAQVDRLYGLLAEGARQLDVADRERAAGWVLERLADAGVKSPAHLARLTGVPAALADAPFFVTVEGEHVSLRAVADEISTREKVAVFEQRRAPGAAGSCVLSTTRFDAPWVEALEALFGKTSVWRVQGLAEWEREVREADPPEGTPLLKGLKALRRELRLLRAGALGRLTPDELEDVRLSRDGGAQPWRYDPQRKLIFLDPEHPDVARVLPELPTRPERLWVLLAALFGLVNRALERVTDDHEAQLLLALARHLASNPKLLG
jgi:hypothetical protein